MDPRYVTNQPADRDPSTHSGPRWISRATRISSSSMSDQQSITLNLHWSGHDLGLHISQYLRMCVRMFASSSYGPLAPHYLEHLYPDIVGSNQVSWSLDLSNMSISSRGITDSYVIAVLLWPDLLLFLYLFFFCMLVLSVGCFVTNCVLLDLLLLTAELLFSAVHCWHIANCSFTHYCWLATHRIIAICYCLIVTEMFVDYFKGWLIVCLIVVYHDPLLADCSALFPCCSALLVASTSRAKPRQITNSFNQLPWFFVAYWCSSY